MHVASRKQQDKYGSWVRYGCFSTGTVLFDHVMRSSQGIQDPNPIPVRMWCVQKQKSDTLKFCMASSCKAAPDLGTRQPVVSRPLLDPLCPYVPYKIVDKCGVATAARPCLRFAAEED